MEATTLINPRSIQGYYHLLREDTKTVLNEAGFTVDSFCFYCVRAALYTLVPRENAAVASANRFLNLLHKEHSEVCVKSTYTANSPLEALSMDALTHTPISQTDLSPGIVRALEQLSACTLGDVFKLNANTSTAPDLKFVFMRELMQFVQQAMCSEIPVSIRSTQQRLQKYLESYADIMGVDITDRAANPVPSILQTYHDLVDFDKFTPAYRINKKSVKFLEDLISRAAAISAFTFLPMIGKVNNFTPNIALLPNRDDSLRATMWKCPKGHYFSARVHSLVEEGCTHCRADTNMSVSFKSMEAVSTILPKMYDPALNDGAPLSELPASTQLLFTWQCSDVPEHRWESNAYSHTHRKRPFRCILCKDGVVTLSWSLLSVFPEVAKLVNAERANPANIAPNSKATFWWRCSVAEDHQWQGTIAQIRSNTVPCPCCAGKQLSVTNSLASLPAAVIDAIDLDKNNSVNINEIRANDSTRLLWWRCSNGHSFENTPSNITRSRGPLTRIPCAYCTGKKTTPENNLATLYPDIAKEFDKAANMGLLPVDFAGTSHKKVFWKCIINSAHVWTETVAARTTSGTRCPECFPRNRGILRSTHSI